MAISTAFMLAIVNKYTCLHRRILVQWFKLNCLMNNKAPTYEYKFCFAN